MKAEEFVSAIQRLVLDASIADTISVVRDPPGRRPARELVELSEWYKNLSAQDQGMVKRLLDMTAKQAVFGFLAVVDGSRQVEPSGGRKGHFELRYIVDGHEDVLSGPNGKILHELLG